MNLARKVIKAMEKLVESIEYIEYFYLYDIEVQSLVLFYWRLLI